MADRIARDRAWLHRRLAARDKVVVYTAVTQNYDPIKVPAVINPQYDYVAYVDAATEVPAPWQHRSIITTGRNPRVTTRYYKLHPHLLFPKHRLSIYVDASLLIKTDFAALVEISLRQHDAALFRHPERDCVYEEGKSVILLGMDAADVVERQMAAYRAEGYPEHNGLFAGGLIIRRHHAPLVKRTMEDWWREIQRHSQRDQLSGPVAFWRSHLPYYAIDGVIFSNPYVEWMRTAH